MTLRYSFSNENLDAIFNGLLPKPKDTALVVGGSGDQAFALLSSGAKVMIIDNNPDQIDYIKRRINYLICESFSQFLNSNEEGICDRGVFSWDTIRIIKEKRDAFFSKEMISKIASNLENLSFSPSGDLFDFLSRNGNLFNMVYCSNVLNYGGRDFSLSLEDISSSLKPGALCYVSCEERNQGRKHLSFLNLKIDFEKTEAARLFEPNWFSLVYLKP